MNNKYNKLIQKRIEGALDSIIVLTSFIALASSSILYMADLGIYALLNFIVAIFLLLMAFFANKIQPVFKIITLVVMFDVVATASFIGGQLTSAYLSLLILSVVLATLFLGDKLRIIFSNVSISLMFAMMCYYISMDLHEHFNELIVTWGLKSFAFILLVYVLNVSSTTIKRYLIENIENLEVEVKKSNKLAFYDSLTGLPNTHKFKEDSKKVIERNKTDAFVMFFTLKSLNQINATLGHKSGDQALIEASEYFKKIKTKHMLVARTGGSEFVALVMGNDEERLRRKYNEFLANFIHGSDLFKNNLESYAVYAKCKYGQDSFDETYQRATLTLTYVKNQGIQELTAYNSELEKIFRRIEAIKDSIKVAVDSDEFNLVYQPQYSLNTGKVVGVEALTRWNSKSMGYVSPLEFIPVIDTMYLTEIFGDFVLHRAFRDYKLLKDKYHEDISVSINISPLYLMNFDLVKTLKEALIEYEVPGEKIILEITEDVFIDGIEKVGVILRQIKELGVEISLDDFGTGYSSFSYLAQLALDELKIDKSLTDQLVDNGKISILFAEILKLAEELDLRVVVEGIELSEQDDILKKLSCNYVQGYYYSKPEVL